MAPSRARPLIAPDDLEASLVQVRAAYRLLHAFQLRVNDLYRTLDDALQGERLRWRDWAPRYNRRPPQAPFFRNRWAWDLFPGHSPCSSWSDDVPRESDDKPGHHVLRSVRVTLVVDDGRRPLLRSVTRDRDLPVSLRVPWRARWSRIR